MTGYPASALHGIHAIGYALFDESERLDRSAMRRQTEICLRLGVDGLAALGLATEVAKLSDGERRTIMDWTAEDNGGRLPLAFTIAGNSVAEQADLVRHAERSGADWVILQPPAAGSYGAGEYIRFFGRVADATTLPVAIQNAPAYMGRGLDIADIEALTLQHPNIQLIKGEGPVVDIARLIEATQGRLPVFNGRAGLEMIDNFRIGCRGLILAPDCIDRAVRAYGHYRRGDPDAAERHYKEALPAVTFVMQGLEMLICYGKRLFAARAGLTVHDRAPALRPTDVGLAMVARFAGELGPLYQPVQPSPANIGR